MASSRKVGTNEEIATYGTGKTYTSLATWEADTDIDLVTATKSCVLEVYGNSYNDGNCILAGATTNTSYFRIIRPASGNKLTSGAISTKHFNYTPNNGNQLFSITEENSEIQDLVVRRYGNFNGNMNCLNTSGHNSGFVGCVAIDCANAYLAQDVVGIIIWPAEGKTSYAKNCLAHNCDGSGFALSGAIFGTYKYPVAYNCTSVGNRLYGFSGDSSTYCTCYGCGADGNSGGDFSTIALINCSDATPTFAAGTDNFHLGAADTVWKGADTNTGSWHSSCGYDDDVDGDTRSGSWDIGWDEYYTAGSTINPYYYYLNQ